MTRNGRPARGPLVDLAGTHVLWELRDGIRHPYAHRLVDGVGATIAEVDLVRLPEIGRNGSGLFGVTVRVGEATFTTRVEQPGTFTAYGVAKAQPVRVVVDQHGAPVVRLTGSFRRQQGETDAQVYLGEERRGLQLDMSPGNIRKAVMTAADEEGWALKFALQHRPNRRLIGYQGAVILQQRYPLTPPWICAIALLNQLHNAYFDDGTGGA